MKEILTFAVLVDGENTPPKKYADILSEIGQKGNTAIKWVYADWTNQSHKGWKDIMLDTGSAPKQQFHHAKDAADHALIMDAIELVCTNEKINAMCIVSSDGGFAGLAQRIREKGLHVMAVGKKDTPAPFRNATHDFVYLENINREDDLDEVPVKNDPTELDELLLKAYWQLVGDGDCVYLGDLGTKLKQLDSAFDSRNYQSASLKKLIQNKSEQLQIHSAQEDRCYVRLSEREGKVKATPKKGKNFAFIVHNGEEFYFRKDDLLESKQWPNIKEGKVVYFQETANISGLSPRATNVRLAK
ncbi:NYN domain-containing protein [Vibrio parahaemolyticus]|nr:NYN domain-containing protein [Vibrio parahaemolyticus]EIT7131832.1 NYN domain-containing protein [Vibrio parahaemolyticus]EIZ1368694.1 NYN domain-containing protein [Vibrio parahaemolyticus]EIZ4252281.1 NYN domain-containing protein [Vibrio parahaemolyticus]